MRGAPRQAWPPLGGEQSCLAFPFLISIINILLTEPCVFNPWTVGSDAFSCQLGQSSAASVWMPAKPRAMFQGIRSNRF